MSCPKTTKQCPGPGLEPRPLDTETSALTMRTALPPGGAKKLSSPESQTLHRKVKVPWPVPSHAAVQGFERLMLAVYCYNYGASAYDK